MNKLLILCGILFTQMCYAGDVIFQDGFELPCQPLSGLQTRGNIRWFPAGGTHLVDYGQYRNSFGRDPGANPVTLTDFPGVVNYILSISIGKTSYMAAQFTVPAYSATYTNKAFGTWSFTQTGSTSTASMSLSKCPGDFVSVSPECVVINKGEGHGINWKSPESPLLGCKLIPGQSYYLNISFRNEQGGTSCASTSCTIGVKSSRSVL